MAFRRLDSDGRLKRPRFEVCYLCGEKLTKPRSMDHIPPRDFFAEPIIEELRPDFWTIPTHEPCNNAYKDDEEYLVATLRYHVHDSYSGAALTHDFLTSITKHEGTKRLFGKSFREMNWEHTQAGSTRMGRVVSMDHEDHRIDRVFWKIVRGLYFLEREVVLPEKTPLTFGVLNHISQMTEANLLWWQTASGSHPYPHVFDYRFKPATDTPNGEEQWMLYLWEGLTWMASFPPPTSPEEVTESATTR